MLRNHEAFNNMKGCHVHECITCKFTFINFLFYKTKLLHLYVLHPLFLFLSLSLLFISHLICFFHLCAFTYHSFSRTFHIIMIDKTPYHSNLTLYYTQKINRVQVTTYNSTTAIYLSDGCESITHKTTVASFHFIIYNYM